MERGEKTPDIGVERRNWMTAGRRKNVRGTRDSGKGGGNVFPAGFTWGVAAASYQVEGAAAEDGRGESVWDMLCRKPGAVWNGHTGDIACDHYHRYREDVAIMKAMGVNAYRLSVAWPRVLPGGTGAVNAKGLAFYDRLVDELLAAGVTPWITMFHWDFPLALYKRGGWLNRDSADWFADYATVVVRRLGDRVRDWMTHNEPQCTIGLGHQTGVHAPGDKLATAEWLLAGHNLLRSHGKCAQAIRAASPGHCRIGYAPVGHGAMPASASAADVKAAREWTFAVKQADSWNASWWMDPVVFGKYPADGLKLFGANAPAACCDDMETIRQPLDFVGMNIYHCRTVKAGKDGCPVEAPRAPGYPINTFTWPVAPSSLYWLPKFWQERYGLPIVITENGMCNTDWVSLDGKVHDPQRIDFLRRYLMELRRAAADGVDVRGYFQWSIMDNFEWAEGYKQRFGLVHVDYQTQKRTPKDSAWWYRDVIASNGASLDDHSGG
jgi:beta-glucosidase